MTAAVNPIDEVLRHHSTDRLVRAWRNADEKRRYESTRERLGIQEFGQILGIFMGFVGLCIGGVCIAGALFGPNDGRGLNPNGIMSIVAVILAVATYAHFARRSARTSPLLDEVAPFLTTPAAAWAYAAMWASDESDHARAEQFRTALDGLPADRQVKAPEHAALLVLGHAAAVAAA